MDAKNALRTLVIVAGCLAPGIAAAQYSGAMPAPDPASAGFNNEVDVGIQYQSENSALAGRYNGMPDQAFYFIGGFQKKYRSPWDSGGTTYFEATGDNLSFDGNLLMPNGSASVKYGKQGQWGGEVYYDGISFVQSQTFHTIYTGSGTTNGAANNTPYFNSAQLAGQIQTHNTGVKRDKFGGNMFYMFGQVWNVDTGFEHEHKDGTLEQSLLFGAGKNAMPQSSTTACGVPATCAQGNLVYFPQKINSDTDRFHLGLSYNAPNFQVQLAYSLSKFTDNNVS